MSLENTKNEAHCLVSLSDLFACVCRCAYGTCGSAYGLSLTLQSLDETWEFSVVNSRCLGVACSVV